MLINIIGSWYVGAIVGIWLRHKIWPITIYEDYYDDRAIFG